MFRRVTLRKPQQQQSTLKKLIHVSERYEDESYRREVYERWMQEWAAASAQLADINKSPFYGQGWRVD